MLRRPVAVRGRPGLLGTVARTAVVAGTATMTANAVNNMQSRKAQAHAEEQAAQQAVTEQQLHLDALQQQVDQQNAAPAAPAAPEAGADLASKLKQLGDLRTGGVLSEEEFAAAKAKLLGL